MVDARGVEAARVTEIPVAKQGVPLVDLYAQYLAIQPEIDESIQRVVASSAFIGGEDRRRFEVEFAAYCQAKACVGVGNGTDALHLSLRAMGIGAGDEVITVSHTFIATTESISMTGAKPVFVDILHDTMLMDPEAVEGAITPRTRAIVPVHLYGQCCDMDRIMDIAGRYNLRVIEDAAQSHGARWRGRRVGALGDAACFSFYPGKNLGAYGDGGAVVSDDEDLAQRVRMLANHGRLDKYIHRFEAYNSRLDGLQAAILRAKLRHLDEWNDARRGHAARYTECLQGANVVLPGVDPHAEPVWHLYVVRVAEREQLQARLKERGIASGVHYPVPLHRQPAYGHLKIRNGALPVTEKVAAEVVSLPMFAELEDHQVARIAEIVREHADSIR